MKAVVGLATGLASAVALSACAATPASSPTPTPSASPSASPWPESECTDLAATVGAALQGVVDSYDQKMATSPSSTASPSTAADSADIQDALEQVRQSVVDGHCVADTVRTAVDEGIADVEAQTPLAEAVRAKLVAGLDGRIPDQPVRLAVFPDDDLYAAIAEAPAGSTLLLSEGEWILDQPLVLINGITLVGKGPDATTLTSGAEEAAVLIATGEPVGLESLTLARDAAVPGSGVVAGGGANLSLTEVEISGGKTGDAGGGAGVMLVGGDEGTDRGTTFEATDIAVRDNGWAGIAVTGTHQVSIRSATFTGNGECGLCVLGAADGSVSDATFTDNKVGIAVAESAHPTLLDLTIDGGEVGLQAEGSAAPIVEGATITGASRAAVIIGGESTGALASVVCQDVDFGIVVTDTAAPTLTDNDCALARGNTGSGSPSPEG